MKTKKVENIGSPLKTLLFFNSTLAAISPLHYDLFGVRIIKRN